MDNLVALASITVVIFLTSCGSARAKCPLAYVSLEGEVEGVVAEDDQIVIKVSPDSNTLAAPVILKDGHFKTGVAFDTTRSGSRFHHDCSRRPTNVTIVLLSATEELDQVNLSIEADFTKNEDGDYSLSIPLALYKERSAKP